MGRHNDPWACSESRVRLHVEGGAMTSHIALVGAAVMSIYMGLYSAVHFVDVVKQQHEQGAGE